MVMAGMLMAVHIVLIKEKKDRKNNIKYSKR